MIEIEQQRFAELGLQTVVKPVSLTVGRTLVQTILGNDVYILTGIRVASTEMLDDQTEICLTAGNDSLQCTQRELAEMGTSVVKLLKDFIIIRTTGEREYSKEEDTAPYRLDFIKISPVKKK